MIISIIIYLITLSIEQIKFLLQGVDISTQEYVALITALAAVVNVITIAWQAWKRGKPEVKKLESEADSVIVDSAHDLLESSKINAELLKERVDELRSELEAEKQQRKNDADYFRRRIKEIDKELRDYRSWAARLAKQVIETGIQPVPFISTIHESDPLINAITKEQEELVRAKISRQGEIDSSTKKEDSG